MAKVLPANDQNGAHHGWIIFCPERKYDHLFDKRWAYSSSADGPTFQASIPVNSSFPEEDREKRNVLRCHSFITDGKIQFLSDCDRALKNQTADLPDFDH